MNQLSILKGDIKVEKYESLELEVIVFESEDVIEDSDIELPYTS